ncbi:hypothetical protein C8Q77DRAFT_1061673 [Trametes polyzona]|nr:hypothetical protein C8Q77DRAFT_1061673 [Trametes polyzona]
MSRKALSDLPRELLVEILKLLDHVHITRCRRVCNALNTLIGGNTALLYQIELGIEDFVDSPAGGLCTSERYNRLLERRNRWLTLDWSHVLPLTPQDVAPQAPLPYELQGGTFLNVRSFAGQITINQTVLPTAANPRTEYTQHVLQMNVMDITTDPTQDLIAVLDIRGRVHVWSLTTYTPHPRAAEPLLRPEGVGNLMLTALYIAHDLIALVEWADMVRVTIWNWQTGRVILTGGGHTLPYLATGLAWLSPRAFVLADASRGELAIFSLQGQDCSSPSEPLSFLTFRPCARLQLPRIDHGWHISLLQLEITPLLAKPPRDRPFTAAPGSHIVVLALQYVTHNHRRVSSRYMGFVHSKYLASHIPAAESNQGGAPPKIVPWAQWGPKNARVLTRSLVGAAFARYVYGQKVVYSRAHSTRGRQLISVYDFNVHPKRVEAAVRMQDARGITLVSSEEDLADEVSEPWRTLVYMEVVDWPTVIRRDSQSALQCHPFVEDVESALPYVETTRLVDIQRAAGGAQGGASFMMDEERLIELRHYGEGNAATDSIRVYTL